MKKMTFALPPVVACLAGMVLSCGTPPPQQARKAAASDTTVARVYDNQLGMIEKEFVPLVKEVPEPAFAFAPRNGAFEKARTFAEQVKHVGAVLYLVSGAALGEKPPLDLGSGENGPDTVKSKAQVVEFIEGAFAYAHKAMNGLTAENQVEMVDAPFPGMKKVARGAMATLALWHTMDHYGQMVVYARMNKVVPPASR